MLGHRICFELYAAWGKRQTGTKRLEAVRALGSPPLPMSQTCPLGYKPGNKVSTAEVTVFAQCRMNYGKEWLLGLDVFIVMISFMF